MSARIRTIVAGVATLGPSDPAAAPGGEDPVLEPAVELARRLGAALHVVHVFELPDPVLAGYPGYLPYTHPDFHVRMAAELRDCLERQAARFGYANVRCHALEGSAGRTLVDTARELGADLVVVGATRRGRVWRSVLGTTADRVIRGAAVPVLVLHRGLGDVRRVLLTTDLSEESARLLERGAGTVRALFGDALDTRTLMVVWFDLMLPPPLQEDALREAAAGELRRFVAAHALPGEPTVRFGEVAREIVREADEWKADLVVLGTHGRSGFSRLALGSAAAATLRGAGCNVLVVPRGVRVEVPEPALEPAGEAVDAVPALVF